MAVSEAQSAANIQSLKDQGYSSQQIGSYDYGNKLNPNEAQKFVQQMGPSDMTKARNQMQSIASQEYKFDPNQFLPGIQQQASSIYDPQQAQLEAIRLLQGSQYEDTRTTTEKQFNDQMQSEIEAINKRGAYFSGGAIQREQDLGDLKMRALNQLGLQASAADFSNLAQQGLLAAEEAQFIQDRLYNAESGAYARWSDQRNFSYQAAVQQYQTYAQERDFARNVFESDRTFDANERRFQAQYDLDKEKFEMAKEEWNIDMKIKGLSYDQALEKFKTKYDTVDYFTGLADWKKENGARTTKDTGNVQESSSEFEKTYGDMSIARDRMTDPSGILKPEVYQRGNFGTPGII